MKFFNYPRGEKVIEKFINELDKGQKSKVVNALRKLNQLKHKAEDSNLDIKHLRKGLKVFELRVAQTRIFFAYKHDDVYILHISKKQKGETEQNDINKAIDRYKKLNMKNWI